MAEYGNNKTVKTDDFEGSLKPDVVVVEEDKKTGIQVIEFMAMDNIAIDIDENELNRIGQKAKEEYEGDLDSMDEWFETYHNALNLAKQVRETKTFPWRNSSNVKVPLIGQAAMNFNARAYPEIVQGDQVVKAKVVGDDPEEQKAERAKRISEHMSYQLLDEIPNWESDTDKLLIMLPITGTMFREVGWNEIDLRPEVNLLMPNELIVNYHSKSLDLSDCRRISKKVTLFKNDILERERAGLWLEINYSVTADDSEDESEPIEEDEQIFIQQLRYLDLDDDGYEEPYMVTFHLESGRVVRIVANYDEATVSINPETNDVIKIDPYRIYTDYHFIPAFDGSFYSTGFGSYLYPISQSVDTIMNQLIDAGTLANTQGGFLGKGIRSKMGSTPFQPGEWRPVETKGGDIKNNIVPLPTKEPSGTLFQLLIMLIDMGKEMSSITDVMSGVPQGQNTPVGTTLAMIEQGMKVIDAVYKRIYRALKREYQMLYRINGIYLSDDRYSSVLDNPDANADSDYATGDFDIMPVGDTRISSQVMRTMKAQAARDIAMNTPNADVRKATMRVLEAMDIPNPEEILPELPPSEVLMQQIDELKGYSETMTQQMQALTQQLQSAEEARKDQEIQLKALKQIQDTKESNSKIAKNMSGVALDLAETDVKQSESLTPGIDGVDLVQQNAVSQVNKI